jgi:cytidylate kinase
MKIAIDGPAGAGKSTIARTLSRELGFIYIDTGAMYRALTLKALMNNISIEDSEALCELAQIIDIHFEYNFNEQKLICEAEDLTDLIRSPQVSAAVSTVASFPEIREIMVKRQQEMARNHSVVMDGRDIGECVLPDADYKFYLTASIEERSRRRLEELQSAGYKADMDATKKEILVRDMKDTQRQTGALKILDDSIVIDTSDLTATQVLGRILSIIRGE